MAYLGRKGAAAALNSADIPDNSITSAKIVAGTIEASDVAADMATQAELEAQRTDSSITTLGTVTAGNLSNTAIVYPDGHILQVQGNSTARVTSSGENTTVISQAITLIDYANNDILIHAAGVTCKTSAGGTGAHFGLYVCGGSLGATTSGVLYPQQIHYLLGTGDEETIGISHWDKAPPSASETYSIYLL